VNHGGQDNFACHGGSLPCEPWPWSISDHSHVREEHTFRLGLGLSDRRRVTLAVSWLSTLTNYVRINIVCPLEQIRFCLILYDFYPIPHRTQIFCKALEQLHQLVVYSCSTLILVRSHGILRADSVVLSL
jgi:hypothetical protein